MPTKGVGMQKTLCVHLFFFFFAGSLQAQVPDISILKLTAPEIFRASFKTTKGEFIIEAHRKWSPAGVDRLYQLITTGFYDSSLLFRVEPTYVVQFGIAAKDKVNRFWYPKRLMDEPIKELNRKGTIAYARDEADDRNTQLFINMTDNRKLDTIMRKGVKGYTPIAKVIKGMNVVFLFNAKYGKRPGIIQDSLYLHGNRFFEKIFPGLDKIITARIIR